MRGSEIPTAANREQSTIIVEKNPKVPTTVIIHQNKIYTFIHFGCTLYAILEQNHVITQETNEKDNPFS
jgi:hypothetical protein